MKGRLKFVMIVALGAGTLGASAVAQERQIGSGVRLESAAVDSNQSVQIRQVDWDDHRRCDGDHDRDDRGCYHRDRDGYRGNYRGAYGYYGNGYYAAPYYAPPAGWYDRNGHWHAYDRDRDRDRRRHDDDDRR